MTVYFIGAEAHPDTPFKIGYTKGAASRRLSQLQPGSPLLLSVLAEFPALEEGDESALHERFSAYRCHNEFFRRECFDAALDYAKHESRTSTEREHRLWEEFEDCLASCGDSGRWGNRRRHVHHLARLATSEGIADEREQAFTTYVDDNVWRCVEAAVAAGKDVPYFTPESVELEMRGGSASAGWGFNMSSEREDELMDQMAWLFEPSAAAA